MGGSSIESDPGLTASVRASSLKSRLFGNGQTFIKSLLQLFHQYPQFKPLFEATVFRLGDVSATMEPEDFYQDLSRFLDSFIQEQQEQQELTGSPALSLTQAYALLDFVNGDNPDASLGPHLMFRRSQRQIAIKLFRFLVETYRHIGAAELLTVFGRSKSFLFKGLNLKNLNLKP